MAPSEATTKLPFVQTSFAPRTDGNEVLALIDGADAMRAMYEAIVAAQRYIWVAGWAMATWVAMIRDPSPRENSRVVNVLGYMAEVKKIDVRVMLYESTGFVKTGHPEALEELSRRGIKCFAHRPALVFSHHSKIVIVDGKVAFVGGIDLAAGRWDTQEHPVLDKTGVYEDGDHRNPSLPGFKRTRDPRMPWHDIHCKIDGPAAFDVTRTFVERWNNSEVWVANPKYRPPPELPVPHSVEPAVLKKRVGDIDGIVGPSGRAGRAGTKYVQVVRSLSKKSGSSDGRTEHSVLDAYIAAIQAAKKSVYIENQYFISRFGKGPVQNPIMQQLAARIVKAIKVDEPFVAILVLPVIPEGSLAESTTKEIMHWQYRTIKRDRTDKRKLITGVIPLWQRVEEAARRKQAPPNRYLSVHSLRGWAKSGAMLFTEQIYVHAKTMIVDDRIAIIGSANVNDRSMLGDRDSEIAAVVVDSEMVDTTMGGRPHKAARFACDLRLRLWQEHLGPLSRDELDAIVDPVASHTLWKERARRNTEAFLQAFPFLPRDGEPTLPPEEVQSRRTVAASQQAEAALASVKGHLVDFPLEWLSGDDLERFLRPDKWLT